MAQMTQQNVNAHPNSNLLQIVYDRTQMNRKSCKIPLSWQCHWSPMVSYGPLWQNTCVWSPMTNGLLWPLDSMTRPPHSAQLERCAIRTNSKMFWSGQDWNILVVPSSVKVVTQMQLNSTDASKPEVVNTSAVIERWRLQGCTSARVTVCQCSLLLKSLPQVSWLVLEQETQIDTGTGRMDGFNQYFSLPAIKPRSWQVQPSANNEKPKVMATKSASNCLSGS